MISELHLSLPVPTFGKLLPILTIYVDRYRLSPSPRQVQLECQLEIEEESITNRLQRQLDAMVAQYRRLEARLEACGVRYDPHSDLSEDEGGRGSLRGLSSVSSSPMSSAMLMPAAFSAGSPIPRMVRGGGRRRHSFFCRRMDADESYMAFCTLLTRAKPLVCPPSIFQGYGRISGSGGTIGLNTPGLMGAAAAPIAAPGVAGANAARSLPLSGLSTFPPILYSRGPATATDSDHSTTSTPRHNRQPSTDQMAWQSTRKAGGREAQSPATGPVPPGRGSGEVPAGAGAKAATPGAASDSLTLASSGTAGPVPVPAADAEAQAADTAGAAEKK